MWCMVTEYLYSSRVTLAKFLMLAKVSRYKYWEGLGFGREAIVGFFVPIDCLYTENSTSQKYDGQLKLCHSDDFPVGRRSVSTGLVQIYLNKQLRGINQKTQRLQSHVADSICRQLGYTNAVLNSPVIVSITKQNYTNCYEGDR